LLDLFKDDNVNDNNDKIELNTRINFKFDINKYKEFKQKNITGNLDIKITDKQSYDFMQESVIPSNF